MHLIREFLLRTAALGLLINNVESESSLDRKLFRNFSGNSIFFALALLFHKRFVVRYVFSRYSMVGKLWRQENLLGSSTIRHNFIRQIARKTPCFASNDNIFFANFFLPVRLSFSNVSLETDFSTCFIFSLLLLLLLLFNLVVI